jgi:hypothetical protein
LFTPVGRRSRRRQSDRPRLVCAQRGTRLLSAPKTLHLVSQQIETATELFHVCLVWLLLSRLGSSRERVTRRLRRGVARRFLRSGGGRDTTHHDEQEDPSQTGMHGVSHGVTPVDRLHALAVLSTIDIAGHVDGSCNLGKGKQWVIVQQARRV